MKQIEIQNKNGMLRILHEEHEILLADGEKLMVEFEEDNISFIIKKEK